MGGGVTRKFGGGDFLENWCVFYLGVVGFIQRFEG